MINEDKISTEEKTLVEDLRSVLNRHSAENRSSTPDFILAEYLNACLDAFNFAVISRASWYGRIDEPGRGSVPFGTPAAGVARLTTVD